VARSLRGAMRQDCQLSLLLALPNSTDGNGHGSHAVKRAIEDHHAHLLNLIIDGYVLGNEYAILRCAIELFPGEVEVLLDWKRCALKNTVAIECKHDVQAAFEAFAAEMDEDVRRIDVDVEMECRGRQLPRHRHPQCDLRGVEGAMALAAEGGLRGLVGVGIRLIAEIGFTGEQTNALAHRIEADLVFFSAVLTNG